MISKKDILKWKSYFEKNGIYVDFAYASFLMKELRKRGRECKKTGIKLTNLEIYRKNMLDNIVMSTQEYFESGYLDTNSFLRDSEFTKVKINPKYNLSPTYRLITSNPCISNLDDKLKNLISAEKGYYLMSLDFKHQEPWIIVNLLDNIELTDVLLNNNDFYIGILKKFGILESTENREIVKKVWNSSIYGSSLNKLITPNTEWINDVYNWINHNDSILSLRRKVEKNLKEHKEIYTIFGLNRSIPYAGDRSIRQAFNSIFQMSGAGALYFGLKTIHNAVTTKGFTTKIKIYFTNHDEYILNISNEVPPEEAKGILSDIPIHIEGWTLPKFDYKVGKNWGDMTNV